MRLFAVLLLLAALAGASYAAPKKPVVVSSTTGQFQQLQAADTLEIPSIAAGSGFACVKVDTSGAMSSGTCGGNPGGSSGQLQYNNAGAFGGFTMTGDCTLSVPNITCTQLNGVAPGYFYNGTDAGHLTGSLALTQIASIAADTVLGNATGSSAAPTATALPSCSVTNSFLQYNTTTHSWGCGTASGGSGGVGTVTSVALSMPGIFSVSGSPITTNGTFNVSLANENANLVFAGPSSGGAAAPTFRNLVGADLPTPGASSLGGVESLSCSAHQWFVVLSTGGIFSCAQPAFPDVSGSASAAQMATNLSAAIDSAFGSAQGDLLCRGASSWGVIPAGTTNFALVSGGTSVCPSWALPPAGGNPLIIGAAQVGSGAGSPPVSPGGPNSAGEGSLYMRTDVSQLWRMWLPPTSVPTRVQEVSAIQTYAVTLGSSPTLGDFLIAACFNSTGLPSANTGWVSRATHSRSGTFDPYVRVVTRLVAPGDTTSQTPCTGGSGNFNIAVKEVSGLDMVDFNNSLQATVFNQADGTNSFSVTIAATTAAANTLGLAFFGQQGVVAAQGPITINSGWGNITTATGGGIGGQISGVLGADQFYSSNSSSVTATGTVNTATSTGRGETGVLILLQPAVGNDVGWQMMSDLTTVESAGSVTSSDARSLNFANGLSATDDGQGNETVSAGPWTGDASISGAAITVSGIGGVAPGPFYSGTNAANLTGNVPAAAMATNLSAAIDSALCSAQGSVIYRDASLWKCLPPATAGWSLTTNGAGANPAWANVSGGGGGVTQVNTNAPWTSGGPITTTGTVDAGKYVKAGVSAVVMANFGGL